jgi:hypothetical protein
MKNKERAKRVKYLMMLNLDLLSAMEIAALRARNHEVVEDIQKAIANKTLEQ